MTNPVTCGNCGEANRAGARFCDRCAAKLPETGEPPRSGYRTVSVLHVDLAGSTGLGERLSPEAVPEVTGRFHEFVKNAVRQERGEVESLVGDGVLAVFGRPEPGVDDALRAVRTALTVHAGMPELNGQVAKWGVQLDVHSSVATGVVSLARLPAADDRPREMTLGDPANVCVKLNEEATAGQVLIDELTRDSVRDDVKLRPEDPRIVHLKDHAPVKAWRVLGLVAEDARQRSGSRMVGRERSMAQLKLLYDEMVHDRCCVLVTILGAAGIGKSRLVEEFLASVGDEDCLVLQGRCLPYGDAITSRPLEQMLRKAAGIAAGDDQPTIEGKLVEVIAGAPGGPDATRAVADHRITSLVARTLRAPVDLASEPSERLLALQQFFERMAEQRPLIMVIDGLHVAQAPLVEFIERLARALSDVPVLMICMARSEFFERQQVSGMKHVDAHSILLKPLDDGEAEEVVRQILKPAAPPAMVERIARASSGNPLHLRHLVSMLIEQGRLRREDGAWKALDDLSELQTPPKVEAVIGARLGQLGDDEKLVIERAAVVGERFNEADLVALLTPDLTPEEVGEALSELVERERDLLQRDRLAPSVGDPGMDGYMFSHMQVQDTAYRRLDRRTRSELHARYARWLQTHAGERVAELGGDPDVDSARLVEQVGYHFASAYEELLAVRKREDATTLDYKLKAGEHLARAGHLHAVEAALLRVGEKPLRRALALLPTDHPQRLTAWLDLADVLRDHDPAAAEREYEQVIEAAEAAGDRRVLWHARLGQIEAQWVQQPMQHPQSVVERLDGAIREFVRQQDPLGLANAYRLRANVDYSRGHAERALKDVADALELAEGDERLAAKITQLYCVILFWGPTHLAKVWPRVEERLVWAQERELQGLEAFMLTLLARIAILQGDAAKAKALLAESKGVVPLASGRYSEVRREAPAAELLTRAAVTLSEALVHIGCGDLAAAEKVLIDSDKALEREGKNVPRANILALLTRVLLRQEGHEDEAAQQLERCRRVALEDQLDVQIKLRSLQALILARAGRADEAERLAEEAVASARGSEQPNTRADALTDMAEVMHLVGKPDAAARAANEAADLYERKGCTTLAAQARALAGVGQMTG